MVLLFIYSLRAYLTLVIIPLLRSYVGVGPMLVLAMVFGFVTLTRSVPEPQQLTLLGVALLFFDTLLGTLPLVVCLATLGHCGRICDVMRGAHFCEQNYLGAEQRQAILEHLFQFSGLCLFLSSGLYLVVVDALIAPTLLVSQDIINTPLSVDNAIRLCTLSLSKGLSFAAPVVIVCLIIELAGGLLEKLLHAANITSELIALRMLTAIVFVGLVLYEESKADDIGYLVTKMLALN